MIRHFKSPLYIYVHSLAQNLILWHEPYDDCAPFYAFEDGLFCPIIWSTQP